MLVSAPSGTVTFLFTDIEGSTRRWEEDAAAMAPALARHDAIVRRTVEANGGHVFKTVGDAFCTVFSRPEAAVVAALAAQAELARADFSAVAGLRVRMAIHTGTTIERDGDYFGPTVNRVARLLAIGHGGQTLLSNVSATLVRDALVAGATLDDLGEHSLKDVRAAERVFQLRASDVPGNFPQLRTPRAMPNNLPFAISSFVGRDEEIAQISAELANSRAVTLVGTGGIGKTRCAVHVASLCSERFSDGIRLVELASIAGSEFVAPAVAAAFDIFLTPDEPALETLVRTLQWRNVLIVLDNCEHVIGEAARTVERILQRCAHATVLATSREPLNIRGECVYRLPSLSLPPADAVVEVATAAAFDAVALFVNRAKAVLPSFALTEENVASVAAICRRLDGIALALELAATRLRSLGIHELEARLQQRFQLLRGGARTDLPRQQTMRALVDWSYELLADDERAVFRRLAVFPNRFDLGAVLDVCAQDDPADDFGTLDLLESLVDKSLVAVDRDERDPDRPYRLLETLREYALEKLTDCGEADPTHGRLMQRCLRRARELHDSWTTGGSETWRDRCEVELDDLGAALGWALEERRDLTLGIDLAATSRRIWNAVAPVEGRRWLSLATAALPGGATPTLTGRLWLAVAQVHVALADYPTALEAARAATGFFRYERDEAERREAETYAGFSLALLGDTESAKATIAPALAAFEALGLEHLAAVAATELAVAHGFSGEYDRARHLYREALARFLRFGNAGGIEAVTVNLAELEFCAGDTASAVTLTADAIGARSSDAPVLMLANMAAYLCASDRFDEARAYARESLTRAEATRRDVDLALSIQHLAAVATLEPSRSGGDRAATHASAARLIGFVDVALASLSSAREYTEGWEYDRVVAALHTSLGAEAFAAHARQGGTWEERGAIATAMRL